MQIRGPQLRGDTASSQQRHVSTSNVKVDGRCLRRTQSSPPTWIRSLKSNYTFNANTHRALMQGSMMIRMRRRRVRHRFDRAGLEPVVAIEKPMPHSLGFSCPLGRTIRAALATTHRGIDSLNARCTSTQRHMRHASLRHSISNGRACRRPQSIPDEHRSYSSQLWPQIVAAANRCLAVQDYASSHNRSSKCRAMLHR